MGCAEKKTERWRTMGLSLSRSQELSHMNWSLGSREDTTSNSSENKGSDPNSLTATGSLYISESGAQITSVYIEFFTVAGPNSIFILPSIQTELIYQNPDRSTLLPMGQTKNGSPVTCVAVHTQKDAAPYPFRVREKKKLLSFSIKPPI